MEGGRKRTSCHIGCQKERKEVFKKSYHPKYKSYGSVQMKKKPSDV
jgi:hypothetical protein